MTTSCPTRRDGWRRIIDTLALTTGEFFVQQAWQLVLLAVLLAASAYCAAAETALFALSRGQLFDLGRGPGRFGRRAAKLMTDPGGVLTTALLWTNVAHILYFILAASLAIASRRIDRASEIWAAALAIGAFLLMVIVGEVLPKTLAFIWPVRLAPAAAGGLSLLVSVNRPVKQVLMRFVVEPLTRLMAPRRTERGHLSADEVSALLALSQKRGLIGSDETELLQEVLELTSLSAGDIMVPRVDVIACSADAPREAVLQLIRHKNVTKLPVYEDDLDHVIGMVYAKRLLVEPEGSVRELTTPVEFVPESAPLERVLMQLRAAGRQMAIVVDEYGGAAGLLTLEDILEEIVGDIPDPNEPRAAPPVQRVGETEWLVDGDLPIHEWADAFPTELSAARFKTVGGFAVSLLGHIPTVGESVEYRNLVFTIEGVRRHRVSLLRVTLLEGSS